MKYSLLKITIPDKGSFTFRKIFTFRNFLFLAVLFYSIPGFQLAKPGIGYDPSWIIALNIASHENFIFGKDIIFTYGPLGFLTFGLPMYTSKTLVFLFYLFVVFNGIYFLYYLFKSIEKKSELVLVSATIFFFGEFIFRNIYFGMDSLCLYFYFTFHIFHYLKHKNLFSLIVASICCLIAFYNKLNAGLLVNILFLIFIIYNFIFKTSDRKTNIVLFAGHFIILYFLSFFLNTDFISYISNSLAIINSYNDAMASLPRRSELLAAGLIIIMVFALIFRYFKNIIRSNHDIFLLFNLSLLGFILFKAGFSRGDLHVIFFFAGMPFVLMLAYLFFEFDNARIAFLTSVVVTAMISLAFCRWFDMPRLNKLNILKYNLKTRLAPPANKIPEMQDATYRRLPERVIREIGDKTVDVLGSEISYIHFNHLKYNPRPVIQSYSAYDEKLININHNKYLSKTAPDYVLYHYGTLDKRHGFWDEPKIYLALLRNYSIIDTVLASNNLDSLILFKKHAATKKIAEKVVIDTLIHFNTRYKIPSSDKILYMKLDYDYTIIGKIKRVLYQPSLVYMKLVSENSGSVYFRLNLPVMRSGVPINKEINDFNDAYTFFDSKGIKNMNSAYFELTGDPRWIKDQFKIQIIEYEVLEE